MIRKMRKFDLISWYDRYSRLSTPDGEKQFARIVYYLFVCIIAIVFIWYNGIQQLNIQSENNKILISQNEQLPSSSSNSVSIQSPSEGQSSVTSEVYKDKTPEPVNTSVEAKPSKVTEPDKPAVESKKEDKQLNLKEEDKKDYGKVNPSIYKGSKRAQISLTFDDGYDKNIVTKVLDVLKSKDLKCTFFVIGEAIKRNPEVWKRAVKEGHQICNHTQNHKNLTKLSDDLIQREITGWESTVKQFLGEDYLFKMKNEFAFIRFPGGNGGKDNRVLSIAQKNGYSVIAWNVETYSSIIRPMKDTHTVSDISKRIESHVVSKCGKGSIVLLHFNQYDAGNLDGMIDGIIKKGFEIKPLSEITR